MEYSFEILSGSSRTPGRCRLFCKLDATQAELSYFAENRLLDIIIWETTTGATFSRVFTKSLAYFLSASSNDAKRRTQKESMFSQAPVGMTLRHMVRGHLLDITEAELPGVEAVIEARILDIGETYHVFVARAQSGGRTDRV